MLDRVYKIAEILAAVAIVFSLVFVGLQIKQNTQAIASQEDSSVWLPCLDLFQMTVSSSEFTAKLVKHFVFQSDNVIKISVNPGQTVFACGLENL
jgi:hypothetical protein